MVSSSSRRAVVRSAIALCLGMGLGATSAQTLQELHAAALGYDATYLAARAQADSAVHRAAQALALKRPSANLTAGLGRGFTDPPASATNPSGASINTNQRSLQVTGRQPLFNRASDVSIEQAEKSIDIAQAEVRAAEQDLIVRLAQAYFDVLAAEDVLAAAQASKKAITEQLASAKRNFEVGTATITDQREAQARFDLVTAQELAAENDLRTKQLALNQLVGRSEVKPRRLATPVVIPALLPASMDAWVSQAEAEHPQVQRAALAREVARLETKRARAGHLPTVDLTGSLGPNRVTNSSSFAPINGTGGTTNSAQIGIQLAVPLYAGEATQNRIKETLALEQRAENDLLNTRRTLAQAARSAYLGVQSGQAQVKALEAAEASSRLALEATQTGYRVGVRVNLDVLNAQTQLFQTQRDLAVARYNVLLSGLRLRQLAGRLSAADLQNVDALTR